MEQGYLLATRLIGGALRKRKWILTELKLWDDASWAVVFVGCLWYGYDVVVVHNSGELFHEGEGRRASWTGGWILSDCLLIFQINVILLVCIDAAVEGGVVICDE